MKKTSRLSVVLAYEFKKMAFNKTFVIITLLGPLLMGAITVLPAALAIRSSNKAGSTVSLGVLSPTPEREAALRSRIESRQWQVQVSENEAQLSAMVEDGRLKGYLVFPENEAVRWYTKGAPDMTFSDRLESIVNAVLVDERLEKAGYDTLEIRQLMHSTEIAVYSIGSPSAVDGHSLTANFLSGFMVVMVFCMLIYMTVLLYGQQIGRSVVAEKSSKIVDVLLSSVSAEDLLFGKILGIGAAGMLQYFFWIGTTALALALVNGFAGIVLPVAIPAKSIFALSAFFIGGYLLYASIYAATGAASEDDQHMAQMSLPVVLLLIIPIVLMQSMIGTPDSPLAVFMSYFPFTSPIVMVMRSVLTDIALWKIAVSLALLALAVVVMVGFSAKIFRTGILMTGKNFTFKDIARWLRS